MANVASTSIRLNTDGPAITFTLLGHGGKKDLFLSEEEALTRAKVLGCPGTTHKHGSRHMKNMNVDSALPQVQRAKPPGGKQRLLIIVSLVVCDAALIV